MALDPSGVTLVHQALGELGTQMSLGGLAARKHHQPAGDLVETVDGERIGKLGLQARDEAVFVLRQTPRH